MTGKIILAKKDVEIAVRMALWASLITVGAFVSIPLGPVPFTLQSFFVILSGFAEGPRAFFPALVYLVCGFLGLPVFAGGNTGPGFLFGPTAGFALAFPLAAALSGLAARDPKPGRFILFGALASLLIHFGGVLGLRLNLSLSFVNAFYVTLPFLPGAGVKVAFASALIVKTGGLLQGPWARPDSPSSGGGA
ncbi:MAG: biotin transporter BioY [Deltaproteobacteria bacterium]|jgi:biotin transport system substrate-specific component|nr:biotin transporter BioY [Deltaproteobacteria bacterium]